MTKENWQDILGGAVLVLVILLVTISIPGGVRNEYDKLQREAVEKGYAEWKVQPDGKTKWSWK